MRLRELLTRAKSICAKFARAISVVQAGVARQTLRTRASSAVHVSLQAVLGSIGARGRYWRAARR